MKLMQNWKQWILLVCLMVPTRGFSASIPPSGIEGGEDFQVLGVIASSREKQGVALLKSQKSQKTFALKQGQSFGSDMKLVDVNRKFIEIDRNGIRYKLQVGELTSSANFYHNRGVQVLADGMEKDGEIIKVTAEYKKHMITNELDKILMQAATVPYYDGGKLKGFTIWDIEPDSVFEKFGLKNGDTITSINDFEINDLSSTLKLLTSLKDKENASFRYLRGGQEHGLSIEVQ